MLEEAYNAHRREPWLAALVVEKNEWKKRVETKGERKDPSRKGSNLRGSLFMPRCADHSLREGTERGKRDPPFVALEETDPGPCGPLRASRASYEIYKHASALQIIH